MGLKRFSKLKQNAHWGQLVNRCEAGEYIAVLFTPSVGKNQLNYLHNQSRRKTNKGWRWWGFSKDFPSQSYKYESQRGHNWTVVETSVNLCFSNMEDKSLYSRYFPFHNSTCSDVSTQDFI